MEKSSIIKHLSQMVGKRYVKSELQSVLELMFNVNVWVCDVEDLLPNEDYCIDFELDLGEHKYQSGRIWYLCSRLDNNKVYITEICVD